MSLLLFVANEVYGCTQEFDKINTHLFSEPFDNVSFLSYDASNFLKREK